VFVHGIPPEYLEAAQSLELGQEYCGAAAASRQPLVADKQRIACDPNGRLVRTLGATAYACYPLKASDGRLLGTFAVASATRESFADDEAAFDTSSAVRLRSPPSTIPDRIMSRLFRNVHHQDF
jgi:GAF domain-containing protein